MVPSAAADRAPLQVTLNRPRCDAAGAGVHTHAGDGVRGIRLPDPDPEVRDQLAPFCPFA
jgi:hypothetical protein